MADINIEKKKKSPIGWIILGIVVIGLIIWFAASDNESIQETADYDREQEQTSEYGQEQSQAIAPYNADRSRTETSSRVQEYLNFVDERADDDLNRTVVQEGITKLSDALMAVSTEQTQGQDTWGGEIEQIKSEAGKLQDENLGEQHSTVIRSAFSSAANVIQNIQNQYYPGLEDDASDVMDAAQEIEAQELASEQKSEIHSFFEKSADILKKMEERSRPGTMR
jgi:hypothetical protein